MMNMKRFKRFLELCEQENCTEIELDEWSAIGLEIARHDVPELLEEIERLKTIIEKVNSYDPHIIPDIQSGAITIHD